MTEREALERMVAPGTRRPGKYREGVIQIHITRACDKACFGCTQGSNLAGRTEFISPEHFEAAVLSLRDYFGVVGIFGGNPALHPQFSSLCEILRRHIPYEQRGLWCNHPVGKGKIMQETFNPAVSNLNVHLDRAAYDEFKRDWPECHPVGLERDSRHNPVHLAMRDIIADEGQRWELISRCDINQHWSAMIGVFRGQLRAWFCEVAGAQSILHQDDPDYPDTGIDPTLLFFGLPWWKLGMSAFASQVRKHCHECGVPLKGYGELAMAEEGIEQTSATHASIFRPKRRHRPVQVVTDLVQLGLGKIQRTTDYLGNAKK